MKRRAFIHNLSISTTGCMFVAMDAAWGKPEDNWNRIVAVDIQYPQLHFPNKKRIPLGWKAFPVSVDAMKQPTIIRFQAISKTRYARLRVTAAIDIREEIRLTAYLPETEVKIGEFDIRYAHPFQPFEIPVELNFVKEITKQGVALKMEKGTKDVWFFMPDPGATNNLGLQPHLLVGASKKPEVSFRRNLLSMNSFSPFGWMGGCVNDALWEMSKCGDIEALEILKLQLSHYLDGNKGIIFENPSTEPLDGTFNSIEDFLPFAAINGLYPIHPSIDMVLQFMKSKENPDGMILSGDQITTEACYTVAYPLACIAVAKKDQALAKIAIDQIRFRTKYLTNPSTIYQRTNLSGNQSFANWGRGVTWYLLGMVKTLQVLINSDFRNFPEIEEVKKEFRRAIAEVSKMKDQHGFWCSFIDRRETGIDASASAGIAAAILIGCNLGLVDSSYRKNMKITYNSLLNLLTPDGFLTHICQINRGGEALQAGGYRVISQFGMGLLAQLQNQIKQ